MKTYLEKFTSKQCSILGLLTGGEMSELLNICSLVLGKPGGSQKEECLTLGIPMMILFCHENWESENQRELEHYGYALSYNPQEPIVNQLERHLLELRQNKLPEVKRLNWKELVPQAIEIALNAD